MSSISKLLEKYRILMKKSKHNQNINTGNIPNEPNLHLIPTKNHDHIHIWIKNIFNNKFIYSFRKINIKKHKLNSCLIR